MKIEIVSRHPERKMHQTPILFVHGAFAGAWCWEEYFLPYFAEHGYVSHALSFRGHGESEGNERVWFNSIPDYIDDLIQAIRDMERPPVLVGHSMGGWIVQKHLESFERPGAVLLASIPPAGLTPVFMRMLWHHPTLFQKIYWINMLPKNMWEHVATLQEMRDLFFTKKMPTTSIEKYLPLFQRESYRVMWDLARFKFLPQSWKVKTPLLVMGAADDVIIPPEFVNSTARLHNTQAHIFSDMGHAMMLDRDWQEPADRMLNWFDEIGID